MENKLLPSDVRLGKLWLSKAKTLEDHIALNEETNSFLRSATDSKNNFVLYAVDTDIVKCYTSPWALGVSTKTKTIRQSNVVSYGEIFPPDIGDFEAASSLTFALANYIFFELCKDWPVFQLPTHSRETTNVFSAVATDARLHTTEVRTNLSLLETWAEDVAQSVSQVLLESGSINNFTNSFIPASEKESFDSNQLQVILNQLEKYVVGRGQSFVAEMDRYLSLLIKGVLISTDDAQNILDFKTDNVNHVLSQLSPINDVRELIFELDSCDKWTDILTKLQLNSSGSVETPSQITSRRRHRKILTDARALARLETLNRHLESINGRLILITGSGLILDAADRYSKSFKNKYIRHFHSFIPNLFTLAEGIHSNVDNGNTATPDLLGFRAISYSEDNASKKISHSIKYILDSAPNAFHDIEMDWVSIRNKLISTSITSSDNIRSELTNLIRVEVAHVKNQLYQSKSITDLQKTLNNFANMIRRELPMERLLLASEFATTGIGFLLGHGISKERNPPDVRFDSYKQASDLFAILRANEHLKNLQSTLRDSLEALNNDTVSKKLGVNDLGYLQFLVFAGVFATIGRWSVAAEFASYATDISETKPETKPGSHISGREAYFVQAISTRLSARLLEDYSFARQLLDKAKSALKEDLVDRPDLDVDGYRFAVEGVAINVGELHLKSMRGMLINGIDVVKYLQDGITLLDKAEATPSNRPAKLRLSINLLQLISLLLQHGEDRCHGFDIMEIARCCVQYVDSYFDNADGKSIRRTHLSNAYLTFGKCYLLSTSDPRFDYVVPDIDLSFSKFKGSMAYDGDRYNKLEKQCLLLLSDRKY